MMLGYPYVRASELLYRQDRVVDTGALLTTDDEQSGDDDVEMAVCGGCQSVIPIDSSSCPDCGVSFTGVTDEDDMGECGACSSLVPINSTSCPQCGVYFVLDDLTSALTDWMKSEGITITDLFSEVDADDDGALTADEIKSALERDNFMTADTAKSFGLIDEVVEKRS